MTAQLYAQDAYSKSAKGTVIAHTEEGGIVLDKTIFYPRGGGQPGDSGRVLWAGGRLDIATAVKGEAGQIILVPAEAMAMPEVGDVVDQQLDWDRRYGHMRMHTALHILSVVLPYPVTGGAIAADRGRLDFSMKELPEPKPVIEGRLNTIISRDLVVSEDWIDAEELDAKPDLVKTLSVQPPRDAGRIRLVRIGAGMDQIDLQPCGGTHVAKTGEIGKIAIAKVENKGSRNRRVTLTFAV
ncbi:MAG: alanyl-tRNA editing protein [Pseudomonadota bacterium]